MPAKNETTTPRLGQKNSEEARKRTYETLENNSFKGDDLTEYKQQRKKISKNIFNLLLEKGIPPRIPLRFFHNKISLKDEVVLILTQIYFYKNLLEESREAFRYAAFSISKLPEEEWEELLKNKRLEKLGGIGDYIANLIYRMVFNNDYQVYNEILKKVFK